MNTRIRSIFTKRSLLHLLMELLVVTALVSTQAPQAALAWIDDDPTDRLPPIHPPAFEVPAEGFTWAMAKRYGNDVNQDGMVDTFWQSENQEYYKPYIFPDNWTVYFGGCQTAEDFNNGYSATNTYTWQIVGESTPFSNGPNCAVSHDFVAQGTYTVRLTVRDADGNIIPAGKTDPEYFEQPVTIRDILIVSLGDSYASGEGNPDIPQTFHAKPWPLPGWDLDTAAIWQDERCHRSAISGPSLAAMAIENSDPHTSVTFISFACSGATINRLAWDFGSWLAPLGSGVLGHYWGAVNVGIPYSQTYENYIPPQMDQLEAAMVPPAGKTARQIEALIISGGGNDMHFGDILLSCFGDDDCWAADNTIRDNPYNGTDYTLENIIQRDLGHWGASGPVNTLPDSYSQLHGRINALLPAKPAHVYLTQYPDQTRDDNRNFCNLMDDVFVPNILDIKVNWMEARDAVSLALGPLNDHIREVAQGYVQDGWQFVDGLSVYDVDPTVPAGTPGLFVQGRDGKGHGYCASNNWIRRAEEAELIQGPLNIRLLTRGQMHPNYGGQNAIKERLLRYIVPNLAIQPPQAPPVFSFSHSLNGYNDVVSTTTGWYLESCTSDPVRQCQRKVVAQAVATSTVNLAGAQVSANGVEGCAIEGVSCLIPNSVDPKRLTYDVEITASGIYQFQFLAQDSSGQVSSLEQEIKVDLDAPVLATPIGPFDVQEGGSVDLVATASSPGENVFEYVWDLDNDGVFETIQTTDEQPVFSAAGLDGPGSQTVRVKVTDRAGWIDTEETTVNVLNVAPTLSNVKVTPETINEGDSVTLSGDLSDSGSADSFNLTIDWGDGSLAETANLAAGTKTFSLTHIYADDNPTGTPSDTYSISLSLKDDDGGTATGSTSVVVGNLAPSLSISAPENGTLYAVNATVNLSASLTDPSSLDTLTCSVNWDDGYTETGTLAAGVCIASHVYTAAGVYTIQMTGADDDTGAKTAIVMAVVYDPSEGFVTGGGWIESPAGAYILGPSLAGRADFGFVSKYHKGATIPSGQTEFQFEAGSFYFESEAYDWLVVAGARAQFKGIGAVNGVSGYSFLLTLTDGQINGGGGVDKFRIKVWDASGVVYDNMTGYPEDMDGANPQAIGGGSIVIHNK